MPEMKIDPELEARLSAEWLLIMERLGVPDLAAWIAQYRIGDRASNERWLSWEAIARLIKDRTRVTISTNGLRSRWSDEVDELIRQDTITGRKLPDVPTREQTVGSTGPAGVSGSNTPAGSNPPEGTR